MMAMLAAASACGSSSAQPQPKPALMGVLESSTTDALAFDTAQIVGRDGQVAASTHFTPLPTPYVGCAGALLPPSAHVAAGKLFFIDGEGTVRSLAPDGHVATVTRFAMTSAQQMASFAVSPDGKQLLGTVFTLPPRPDQQMGCVEPPFMLLQGDYALDVYSADAGSPARLLYHQALTPTQAGWGSSVLAFVGWDAVGPLATYPTLWATQGGGPMHYFGIPVRVDAATGKVSGEIANPDEWRVLDIAPSGDFVCADYTTGQDVSVRSAKGSELWRLATANPYWLAFLSPDESRLAVLGMPSFVVGRDGKQTKLTDDNVAGWLDTQTVVAGGFDRDLVYISLSRPQAAVDTTVKGMFIGALPG